MSVQSDSPEKCTICFENVVSPASCREEEGKTLECSHIFHRECIGEWLKYKHNCPVCRAHVEVDTPEAPIPEMTIEEIYAVPDHEVPSSSIGVSYQSLLSHVQQEIAHVRQVRKLNLNEDSDVARTATKVNSFAAGFFGW